MLKFSVSTWKPIPFLRIFLALVAGILVQFHLAIPAGWVYTAALSGLTIIAGSRLLPVSKLFLLRWITGVGVHLVFIAMGAGVVMINQIENDADWIGHHYHEGDAVLVTIQEPLIEKPKSYKAVARIEAIIAAGRPVKRVKGDILLYFRKDSLRPSLHYGSQVVITKPLQPVTNSGNPGAFDYKRYCAFQGIHYQAFLAEEDFKILPTIQTNWFRQTLISMRTWVLQTLRGLIEGKDEVAVAEALLIGYRDDLDKELVQSYSNTGVVHIIAISGLHLGMIYALLVWLFALFNHRRWTRIARPLTILAVLWAFTFLAGAVPSILRSAVMFTFIVAGQSIGKRTSVYNTLAASAFLMLAYNPFYLWDVGFQLSYAAVLSIIAFHRYITNWFYFQNKILNTVWRLCAISLAAQLLTLPVVLYHFHQFPNLFLLTNMIVVPLSAVILFAEILLLIISPVPVLAQSFGTVVEWMIRMMNNLIERTDRIPFAVTDGIQVNFIQVLLLYAMIISGFTWLTRRKKPALWTAALFLFSFVLLRSVDLIRTSQQQKLVVYNVPQHAAIDLIEGGHYRFYGDSALAEDGFLRNFHMRPSRILNRVSAGPTRSISVTGNIIQSGQRTVIVVSSSLPRTEPGKKTKADAIIITGNPRLYINQLLQQYDCGLVVFDATNPLWKIRLWKKDCDSLHLRHHSVPEQGAFEMDL